MGFFFYFTDTPKNASYVNAIHEQGPHEQILLRKRNLVLESTIHVAHADVALLFIIC